MEGATWKHHALEELTTKAKQEYGAVHASSAQTLEPILELIEAKCPATQDAPMVGEMAHPARAVLEKSR